MKKSVLIFSLLLFMQVNYKAGDKNRLYSNTNYVTFNKRFFVDFGLNFGVRSIGGDLSIGGRFLNRFEAEFGIGTHSNTVYVYSTSDKHELRIPHRPTYISLKGDIYNNDQISFYIKATGGGLRNLNQGDNTGNNSQFSTYLKGSVGSQFILWNKTWYIEFFQYYSHLRGTYNSTYDATIDYDFNFYSIGLTLGIKLNPLTAALNILNP